MPETNVLYSVTAAVVVGLVAWVAVVLKTAKEPWARPAPEGSADVVVEGAGEQAAAPAKSDAPAEADAPKKNDAET